jgi:hypothetical protein
VIQGIMTPLGYLEVEVDGGTAESLRPVARIEARLNGKPISRDRALEIIAGMSDGSLPPAPLASNRRREEIDRLIIEARSRFGLDAGDLIMAAYNAGRRP